MHWVHCSFHAVFQKSLLAFPRALAYNLRKSKNGELVRQAEREVRPSTQKPDLDNANVGNFKIFVFLCGRLPNRRFPVFSFKENAYGENEWNRIRRGERNARRSPRCRALRL